MSDYVRLRAAFETELLGLFPSLSTRLVTCFRARFMGDGGVPAILLATDRELLAIRHFGKDALAEFRAMHPEPSPLSESAASIDGWGEHAAMVALV